MAGDFEGQVVVVTGASAGIGAALAEELSNRGARLVLTARRRDKLEQLRARLGGAVEVVPSDMTKRPEVERVLAEALRRFGHVDVWVNNAGRGISREVAALTDEDVDTMIRDNVKSALYGMQAVLPHFKQRGTGTIANVSSMLARVPNVPARSAYSAAKAALTSLTETLRFELAATHPGIRVTNIMPGVVATDFGNNAVGGGVDSRAIPGGQTPEEVAKVIADGLRDGREDLYTRPEGLDRSVEHLRNLAAASRHGARSAGAAR